MTTDDPSFEEEEPQGEEPPPPLDEDERAQLFQDLEDVTTLKYLLEPRGLKGVVFFCPDCNEDHYLAWDLLKGNLREMLDQGESPIHEPAFDPDPDQYCSWDWARGFLDGYETFEDEQLSETADGVAKELGDRGWPSHEVKALLARVGLSAAAHDEPEDPAGPSPDHT